MNLQERLFEDACSVYAEHGVEVKEALNKLAKIPISLHAWQGDDVSGFEGTNHALSGGCQVTGNYPGRARNAEELRADLDLAMSLIPGTKRVNLQAHQVDRMFSGVDRDTFTIENFSSWLDWAAEHGIGMDIAPAYYSHPKFDNGFSLSHPDSGIRRFWIDHGRAVRRIGAEFGKKLGTPAVCNFWVPDGFKDTPADKLAFRLRLSESLDATFAEVIDEKYELDAVESKLFGIGTESYTTGSHDFYLMYAAQNKKLICLDTGHFHPTESIADKISSIVTRQGRILLHLSRGIRWDSDHVIVLNDELLSIGRETVMCSNGGNIHVALDYFDASINRVAAWVIGTRNILKSLLVGLLEPVQKIRELENEFDFTARLAMEEEFKTLPWCAVWEYFCLTNDVPGGTGYLKPIRDYEKRELALR